jgi:hypothetical protein
MGRVDSVESVKRLQEDLQLLFKWSEEWLMLFNADKCGVMHIGHNNRGEEFRIGTAVLKVTKEEKDLGVIVSDDLKVSKQCNKAASSANRMLGMVKRNFICRDREVIIPLYKSIIRPHLDYCVQAWRPHLRKDILRLEKIQRRTTKMVAGFELLPYEERLRRLNLTKFETRMRRADLIEVFKIFRGLDRLEKERFFTLSATSTRGHSYKIFKKRVRLDVGKFSFKNRVCDDWNGLSEEIVSAGTLNTFKSKLDHHLRTEGGLL